MLGDPRLKEKYTDDEDMKGFLVLANKLVEVVNEHELKNEVIINSLIIFLAECLSRVCNDEKDLIDLSKTVIKSLIANSLKKLKEKENGNVL